MATNIGQAYVQIVPSADGISGNIEKVLEPEAQSAGQSAGASIASNIGLALGAGTAAIAAGLTAVTGTIIEGTASLASYGDNIDKASQKMGMSAQAYQEWDAILQHSGTSIDAMKRGMTTLSTAAENDSEAFATLGLSMEDVHSMSQEDLFAAVITGLQNMEAGTQRTVTAQQLLGGSAKELGALLNTSAEDTERMRQRVHELGGVMSDEAVASAAAFQDNLQDLQTAVQGLGRGLLVDLLPGFNAVMDGFTGLIIGEEGASEAITAGFQSIGTAVSGIAEELTATLDAILPGLVQAITTNLPQLVTVAAEIITTLTTAILEALPELITTLLPALLDAGVQIVTGLCEAIMEAGPQLVDAGTQIITMLTEFLSGDGLSQMLEQGVQFITSMAEGMATNAPEVITTIGTILTELLGAILEALPQLLDAGVQLLLSLIQGLVQATPDIILAMVDVLTKLIETITEHLPEILEQGITLLLELAKGIIEAIPDLVEMLPQIFDAIKGAFASFDWFSIGADLLNGIKNGITNGIGGIVEAAKGAGGAIVDGVKGLLQIGSPSKLMADEVGRWIPPGIGVGMMEAMPELNKQIDEAMGEMTTQMHTAVNAQLQEPATASGIAGAISQRPVQIGVTMVGDTRKFFTAMVEQNNRQTRATNYNALAAARG